MAFDEHGQSNIDDFMTAIAPWEAGYTHNSFTYLAVKRNGVFIVIQGAIWLNTAELKAPFTQFATDNIRAGHYRLRSLGKTYRELIHDVASGIIRTPDGDLHFPPEGGHHSASFGPLHPSALQSQSRVNVLKFGGCQQFVTGQPSILDWELRAAQTPYDTIQDLMGEYLLGGMFTDVITIEVIGTSVMAIDGESSRIEGEVATISVNLAKTLPTAEVAVSYRLFNQGKVIDRAYIEGSRFDWTERNDVQRGTFRLAVPSAAVLHCYSLYGGVAQTHWYITDASKAQNSRRSIYEAFDTGAGILNEFLARSNSKGRDARDFEAAVAWLFWMLGFGVAHLGATARTQDFADIILTTPMGNVAVVECTTGLLRADNKLPNLVHRTTAVRRQLDESNNQHLRVLPVIVTTLTKEEVKADLEQAEKLGVLVLTKEEIDQFVTGTLIPGNAEAMFGAAEQRVRDAQENLSLRDSTGQGKPN
jgi:hypothetical protein